MNKLLLILALVVWPVTALAGSHHHHAERSTHENARDCSLFDWVCVFTSSGVRHIQPDRTKLRLRTGGPIHPAAFALSDDVSSVSVERAPRRHLQPTAALAKRPVERTRLSQAEGRKLADFLLPWRPYDPVRNCYE